MKLLKKVNTYAHSYMATFFINSQLKATTNGHSRDGVLVHLSQIGRREKSQDFPVEKRKNW